MIITREWLDEQNAPKMHEYFLLKHFPQGGCIENILRTCEVFEEWIIANWLIHRIPDSPPLSISKLGTDVIYHPGKVIITDDAILAGQIVCKELQIDGSFILGSGLVSTPSTTANRVSVNTGTAMYSNITAEDVYVSGIVDGDIKTKKLSITVCGRVAGDIQALILDIKPGAMFSGGVEMGSSIYSENI